MKGKLLQWLACPDCGAPLRLSDQPPQHPTREGTLFCDGCAAKFPIKAFIPRFVASQSYAGSFGFEWTRFSKVQLDSRNGHPESEERLKQSLSFPLGELAGKLVLDAGCGMGRFMEVALKHGATVVGVDMSRAVDAAYENVGRHPNAHLVQGDLARLPLRRGIFDFIYCLGVLHHTPAPQGVFKKLTEFLRPGGSISITLYSGYNKVYVASTNFWRRFTVGMPEGFLYGLSHAAIPLYHVYRIPAVGRLLQALFPISMHPKGEWRALDTFDCYSPRYQSFHTHFEVFQWFKERGLKDITVLEPGVSFVGTRDDVASVTGFGEAEPEKESRVRHYWNS